MKRWTRVAVIAGIAVASLVAGIAALVIRLAVEGNRAMAESDALFDQGRVYDSLIEARRAASYYAPGLSHVRRADARLDSIAAGAEATKMPRIATLAWQAIRTSELQRVAGWGRATERLTLANRRLLDLLASSDAESAQANEKRKRQLISAKLDADLGPSNGALVGQMGGLVGVVGGLLTMAKALERVGLRGSRSLFLGVGLVLAGAICWATCLLLA